MGVRVKDAPKMAAKILGHRSEQPFLDGYLPYLLGHASFAINKDFDRYVQAFGISALEWRVLATLWNSDGLTIGELARIVVSQQPTLTKAIKKMEEGGLVERRSDAEDLRKTLAFATDQGRSLCEKLISRALQHERQWLRGFSDAEIDTLKRIMQAIIKRGRAPHPFLDT